MHAASVTLDPEIPPLSKCLYNVLTIFAGEKNSCFPSIETLVQVTGMSKDTVYKYLDILEECGVIERQHKRKSGQFRNTVYILCDENRKSPYTVITDTESTVYDKKSSPCPKISDSPCPTDQDTNNNIYKNNKKNNIYCASVPDGTKKAPDKTKKEASELFEKVWALYPSKKGKGQVSDTQKKKLLKIGEEELTRAIERYKADLSRDEWRKPQNGSTFFNSGYVDYLDENWQAGADSSDTEDDAAAWERARAEMERLASIGPRVDGPF